MINHRNKQNYRLRTWNFRDRCHLKGGVRQGCFLSLILNYLIQYIHFRSLYITSHYYAKFKENPCVGTDARPPLLIAYICTCYMDKFAFQYNCAVDIHINLTNYLIRETCLKIKCMRCPNRIKYFIFLLHFRSCIH